VVHEVLDIKARSKAANDSIQLYNEVMAAYANKRRRPGSSRLTIWCYCLPGSSWRPQTARELASWRPSSRDPTRSPTACLPYPTDWNYPPGTNAHPVFHSSLLKSYKPGYTGERTAHVPEAVSVDGQVEYVVDAVLDERVRRGKKKYLVHWAGYHTNDSTWEPVANVLGS
jgi:Chromo (CHRromatin Organisation MOdifier) domain